MKIKVCGIRTNLNLKYLNQAQVDFIGFIFFDGSKRFFEDGDLSMKELIGNQKQTVGVFVNQSARRVAQIARVCGLSYVQLHGNESVEYCKDLNEMGIKLIKAFPILDKLPVDLVDFEPYVDYFLFDTKGTSFGGNGTQFDWNVLSGYDLNTPFILSGGIGLEDVEAIKNINHPKLYAVDVNSRFEDAPGQKNEKLLQQFIEYLKR